MISAISVFYGMHSWHWYLSQGIPVVLASFLPTFLFGWYRTSQAPLINERLKALKYLCVWTVAVYSLLTHKEFRFIYPVVPIMHIIAAYGISQLPARWRKWAVLSTMAINISLGIYTTTVHQRGVVDAVNYIRSEAQDLRRMYTEYDMEVAFLMPCHSTPWQSIIHDKNVNTWMLTCEPPLRMYVEWTFCMSHRKRAWITHHFFVTGQQLIIWMKLTYSMKVQPSSSLKKSYHPQAELRLHMLLYLIRCFKCPAKLTTVPRLLAICCVTKANIPRYVS